MSQYPENNNYGDFGRPGQPDHHQDDSPQGSWGQTGGAQNQYGQSQYGQNQYGQYPQQNPYTQQSQQPSQEYDAYGNPIPHDAKTISLLAHLSSLAAYLLSATILSFAGPLIFWFIYKSKPGYAFVTANSARAFNFNVTMAIANIVAWLLALITLGLALPVSGLIWAATGIVMFIFHIIGAIKSSNGEVYDYPMQIRILKD